MRRHARRIALAALLVAATALAACGGGGSSSSSASTFDMNCYDFMNSTSAIGDTNNSQRNEQNYSYCQRHPDDMDHEMTWDRADS